MAPSFGACCPCWNDTSSLCLCLSICFAFFTYLFYFFLLLSSLYSLLSLLPPPPQSTPPPPNHAQRQRKTERTPRHHHSRYHGIGKWAEGEGESLYYVQSMLDALGYECYLVAHSCVVSLSNTCWDDSYEIRSWSNVMCVSWNKARNLISLLDGHSFAKNNQCKID